MKLNITNTKISRVAAFWIDAMILSIPMMLLFPVPPSSESSGVFDTLVRSFVWMSPMLFRDIFGRSIGKLCLGLEIVDRESGKKAGVLQRFLRNVTFPITTFEGIFFVLCDGERRWGDRFARTEVREKRKSK